MSEFRNKMKDKKVRDDKMEYKVELLWTVMWFVLVLLVLALLFVYIMNAVHQNALPPPYIYPKFK